MKTNFFKVVMVMILLIGLTATVSANGNQDKGSGGAANIGKLNYDPSVGAMKAPANRGNVIDIPFRAKDPLKFSMSFSDASWYAMADTWTVFDDIKNATNCELDLIVIPSTDYNNKRSLLISTGDQPYIMPKSYPGSEVPFIPSGQILAVSEYLDYMPNFKTSVEKWNLQEDLKSITQRDGNYYVIPGLHETYAQDYSMAIRKDILDKHNIAIPESWDDIKNVLRKIKQLYPDQYPYSERWQLGMTFNIAGPAFGLGAGTGLKTGTVNWNNNNSIWYNSKKDNFEFYPITAQYKAMLTYFNSLIKEGLMDPESISQTDEQAVDKFCQGNGVLIGTNAQELNKYREKLAQTLGAGNFEVIRMNVPSGPGGAVIAGNRLENGIMISSKALDDPNFIELMRLVDWVWYSYSGNEMTKWGIEGKTYTFNNGKYSLMPGLKLPAYGFPGKDTDTDLRLQYGYAGGNLILSYGGPKQLQYSLMNPETAEFVQMVNKTRKLLAPAPVILYDEEDLEAQNFIAQPLMDYVFQMTYKFILGQANLTSDWDAFVAECNKKGAQTYIEKANAVYSAQ